jgi:anthranilate synthase component II
LGHQAIGVAYGGTLINIPKVCHGISSKIQTRINTSLFDNLPSSFQVGRYHSWVVNEDTLPSCLRITARDDNDMVMAMEHKEYKVTGVQFHPESVLTEYGKEMIYNWINS